MAREGGSGCPQDGFAERRRAVVKLQSDVPI